MINLKYKQFSQEFPLYPFLHSFFEPNKSPNITIITAKTSIIQNSFSKTPLQIISVNFNKLSIHLNIFSSQLNRNRSISFNYI